MDYVYFLKITRYLKRGRNRDSTQFISHRELKEFLLISCEIKKKHRYCMDLTVTHT